MLRTRCFLALILALSITLAFGALAEADDPVVVRVGDFTYTQSQLQRSLDSTLELSEMLQGDAPTDAQKAAQLEAVVESFVSQGVIENKLAEAGKNGFTDAELEDLNQKAGSKYEELWQLLYQQMQESGETVAEKDVTETLEGMGYTFETILDEYILQTRQNRAIDAYVGAITLSQSEVDEYYEEQFVGPDRADYKDNLEKYESEILASDNESFYTPEGYRTIRQIVLQ